jgi:Protein of unknown function (DUF559)
MRGANLAKTARSRRLRHDSTIAELKLWNRLRSRAEAGFKFVRQEPIGRYVVDFVFERSASWSSLTAASMPKASEMCCATAGSLTAGIGSSASGTTT